MTRFGDNNNVQERADSTSGGEGRSRVLHRLRMAARGERIGDRMIEEPEVEDVVPSQ